jgi:hypothetical protein
LKPVGKPEVLTLEDSQTEVTQPVKLSALPIDDMTGLIVNYIYSV